MNHMLYWDLYYWVLEYRYEIKNLSVIKVDTQCRIAPNHLYPRWIKENPNGVILINNSVQDYLDGLQQ